MNNYIELMTSKYGTYIYNTITYSWCNYIEKLVSKYGTNIYH